MVPANGTLLGGLKLLFVLPLSATIHSGPAGTPVTVSGRDVSTGKIDVYFNNTQVASAFRDTSGEWTANFSVPDVQPGNYTIRAMDTQAGMLSTTSFAVTSQTSSTTPMSLVLPTYMSLVILFGLLALELIAGVAMTIMLCASEKRRRKSSSSKRA